MTWLMRSLLALASGAVWALCFGETALVLVPWLALVPLLLLLTQPRAWLLGWLHGLAFWLVSIPWIVPTLRVYGELNGALAVLCWLLLAAYLALFTALFAWSARRLWRCGAGVWLAGVPAAWVAAEWLRGYLFTGFPWNLAAYAWIEVPGALPLAAWVGPWGVAFLLVMANSGLAWGLRLRRWRPAAVAMGFALLTLALAGRWGAAAAEREGGSARLLPVRLVQPNIGVLGAWDAAQIDRQYRRMLALSRQACEAAGPLVIWPESAAWPYSYSDHERLRRDLAELVGLGCPVLINTSMTGRGGSYNSVLLIDDRGTLERYDKRHLVPFGEYVPLADRLPFLKKIARLAGDFLTGDEGALLAWQGEQLAPAICFEITFPGEVAQQVRAGGSILVTVTNDAWYGDSWAPWQHFRAARFRAAENRRFVLRVAITGVSAIIRPDGSVRALLGVGEEGILTGSIAGLTRQSPFTRAPWLVPAVCVALTVFAILLGRREESR